MQIVGKNIYKHIVIFFYFLFFSLWIMWITIQLISHFLRYIVCKMCIVIVASINELEVVRDIVMHQYPSIRPINLDAIALNRNQSSHD